MVNRKKHEGEKPYNGQQKNHTMVNRKKHEGEKPYNGKQINHTMVNRKKPHTHWSTMDLINKR
jgi:hypothetical protein